MRGWETTARIEAAPSRVWAILTDAAAWPAWESGVRRVEGRAAPGETIRIESEVSPGKAYPVKVAEMEPDRRMVFTGGMPLGLFRVVRTYTLAPDGDGATRFEMREEFTGPMAPLVFRSMPDLGPSFEQFARGLKQQAELTR
jgi:hypothetical protein